MLIWSIEYSAYGQDFATFLFLLLLELDHCFYHPSEQQSADLYS